MKKNVLRALSVLLVLVMVVSLTACGGGKFATVKAFLDDPDTKADGTELASKEYTKK